MNITLKRQLSLDELQNELQRRFTEYTFFQRKTVYGPMLVAKKSNFVGVGIRIIPDKAQAKVFSAFPSIWAQALFGGLLVYAFVYSSMKKIELQIGSYIQQQYGH